MLIFRDCQKKNATEDNPMSAEDAGFSEPISRNEQRYKLQKFLTSDEHKVWRHLTAKARQSVDILFS